MGIIDPHSKYSLYDVLDDTIGCDEHGAPNGSIDFYGFHITPIRDGKYNVQYDGHAGTVGQIDSDEYNCILELVDDLMDYVFEAQHFDYQGDKEALVDWAGKIMTDDPEKAREQPDLYIHIPDDAFQRDE